MFKNINPDQICDLEGAKTAIRLLLNVIEDLQSQVLSLREENQRLRDENNRLKGEQGRPNILENKDDKKQSNISSEKERKKPCDWAKSSKNDKIHSKFPISIGIREGFGRAVNHKVNLAYRNLPRSIHDNAFRNVREKDLGRGFEYARQKAGVRLKRRMVDFIPECVIKSNIMNNFANAWFRKVQLSGKSCRVSNDNTPA